jgi:type IV secretion system protein VirD4
MLKDTVRGMLQKGIQKAKDFIFQPEYIHELVNGFYFGFYKGYPYGRFEKEGHILIVGGSGSGKSACVVIPTLAFFWKSTFLAIDIKGELSKKSGRDALIFDPLDKESFGYDPFYLVRRAKNQIAEIRHIANTLIPLPPDTKDTFWINQSRNILTGHLIFCFRRGATFVDALEVLVDKPIESILEHDSEDRDAAREFRQCRNLKSEILADVMSELTTHIIPLVEDEDIRRALSKENSLTPDMLEYTNIFIKIPEYRLDQWRELLSLIIQQFLNYFERRDESEETQILFMLDEFPRLGKLEGIAGALSTLRSKKIVICVAIQSLAQLDVIYGEKMRRVIVDNCRYTLVLNATDVESQEYFSKRYGTYPEKQVAYGPRGEQSISYVEKPKIRAAAFAHLTKIILISNLGNGEIDKVCYWSLEKRMSRIDDILNEVGLNTTPEQTAKKPNPATSTQQIQEQQNRFYDEGAFSRELSELFGKTDIADEQDEESDDIEDTEDEQDEEPALEQPEQDLKPKFVFGSSDALPAGKKPVIINFPSNLYRSNCTNTERQALRLKFVDELNAIYVAHNALIEIEKAKDSTDKIGFIIHIFQKQTFEVRRLMEKYGFDRSEIEKVEESLCDNLTTELNSLPRLPL